MQATMSFFLLMVSNILAVMLAKGALKKVCVCVCVCVCVGGGGGKKDRGCAVCIMVFFGHAL